MGESPTRTARAGPWDFSASFRPCAARLSLDLKAPSTFLKDHIFFGFQKASWDKRNRQKIPAEFGEKLFPCAVTTAQIGCGVSLTENIPESSGHNSVLWDDPA